MCAGRSPPCRRHRSCHWRWLIPLAVAEACGFGWMRAELHATSRTARAAALSYDNPPAGCCARTQVVRLTSPAASRGTVDTRNRSTFFPSRPHRPPPASRRASGCRRPDDRVLLARIAGNAMNSSFVCSRMQLMKGAFLERMTYSCRRQRSASCCSLRFSFIASSHIIITPPPGSRRLRTVGTACPACHGIRREPTSAKNREATIGDCRRFRLAIAPRRHQRRSFPGGKIRRHYGNHDTAGCPVYLISHRIFDRL